MKKIIAICMILILALPMVMAREHRERGIERALEKANENALDNSRMLGDEERYNATIERQQERKNESDIERSNHRQKKEQEKMMKNSEWRDKKIAKIQKRFQEMQMKGELDNEEINKLALMDDGTREKLEEISKEDLQKKLAGYQVMKYDNIKGFKKRILDDLKKEEHHKKLQELKKDYQENKKAIEQDKEEFKKLKDTIEKCDKQTDCPEAFEKTRGLLLKQLATIVNYNTRLKEKIESNEYVVEETAKKKLEEIQSVIEEINQIAEKVKKATTTKELEELRRDAIKTWKRVKFHLHNNAIGVIENKFNGLSKKIDLMNKRIDATLEAHPEVKEEFKVDLEKFDSLLESAKNDLKTARDLSSKATGSGDETMVNDARKALMKALDEMKEAHKIIVQIVKSLKEKNLELEEVDEVLVEAS